MSSLYLPKHTICSRRATLVACVIVAVFMLMLTAGFVRIQLMEEALDERFSHTHNARMNLPAHRGSILGRDGRVRTAVPLAMNSDEYHINLIPYQLEIKDELSQHHRRQAKELAGLLDMDIEAVIKKMQTDTTFTYLKKNVPAWTAQNIKKLSIPGVNIEYTSKRFYPDRLNFAHIVGFTDWQGIGRAGIEYAEHEKLNATDGEIRYIRAGGKGAVSELIHQPAILGNNVYLTLDRRMQYVVFNALAQAANKHDAQSAAAMVMDIRNGDVLALANYPSYNPNQISHQDKVNQINHALADQIEPGSTVKPFVAALALEHHLASPDEIFSTKKAIRIGKLRVYDKHVREDLDVSGIIRKSSNVGAVQLAQRIGAPRLEAFYRKLGWGGGKVLQLREEEEGFLRPSEKWRQTDFATHAYGYGFALTLPQLVRAYSVFATDGLMVQPRLLQNEPVQAKKRVLSAKTARTVRAMLEEVVSTTGTAQAAAIGGYRVAGKTGTVGKWTDGKFDLERRRVFFVGLAPASQPRYVVAVMIDEPKRQGDSGGMVAAPVFRQIMQQALLFGGVSPDDIEKLI